MLRGIDLSQRRVTPEVMDDPALDADAHRAALRGLGRINRVSGVARSIWRAVRQVCGPGGGRTIRVLDVAAGGADVAIGLWRKARRAGIGLEIDACDVSPVAVEHARRCIERVGASIRMIPADVLSEPPSGRYDVAISALFLHHLSEPQAVRVLRNMSAAAEQGLVVSDLRRSAIGLLVAAGGSRVLSRSPVVHVDAARSVRAAFTRCELVRLAGQAGLTGATVKRCWPWRLLLTWKRP